MLFKLNSFCHLVLSVLVLSFGLFSCSEVSRDSLFIQDKGLPIQINKDTTFTQDVTIGPGVIFEIGDSVSMTFEGDLKVQGEKNNRVVFKPKNISWDFIKILGVNSSIDFFYVSIINGKVLAEESSFIRMSHVAFKNSTKQNYWDGLVAMRNGKSFYGDSITIESNSEGEGIVLSEMDSVHIKNSVFTNVNDGFEVLLCNFAIIENCKFNGSRNDDAIDLNGCHNVVIQNNTFTGISDRCIEIGENSYYNKPSVNIAVVNNLFEKSKIGIESKEGSEVYAGLNTFYKCKYAVEIDESGSVLVNYNSVVKQIDSSIVLPIKNSKHVIWNHSVSLGTFSLEVSKNNDNFPSFVGLKKGVRGKQADPVHFDIERIGELKNK